MTKKLPGYIKNHVSLEDLNRSLNVLQSIDANNVVTQIQTAKEVGLATGTCNLHFQKLEHMGLIRRVDTVTKGRGRSTIVWSLNREKNFFLTMVFDIPFFHAALVDFSGRIVREKYEDMTGISTQRALKKEIDHFVQDAMACVQQMDGCIRQTFVGLPDIIDPASKKGAIDPVTRKVLIAPNFPVLKGMDFTSLMQEKYSLPCYCASLGLVFYYGAITILPPETRAMVIYWDLSLGADAGVGDVVLHYDKGLTYFDFGHVRIVRDGTLCHCGQRGCLEAYVGGWAMLEKLDNPDIPTLDRFINAVLSGDAAAVRVAKKAAYQLGSNIYWAQQIMQIERVLISGALSAIFPVVRSEFIRGLSKMFNEQEILALNPEVVSDVKSVVQQGSFRIVRRQFFYPEKF